MFQLVFKGECTPGTDSETARNNARTLFKANVDQIERMFSGQPVVIRNKLEEAQAEKYKAVLAKHGMVAYIETMGAVAPAQSQIQPQSQPDVAPAKQERPVESPAASSAAAGQGRGVAVEPGERLQVAGEKVDTILSGSGLTLDPVGVTLEEHRDQQAPIFEHMDDWTIAPPGTDLVDKQEGPPAIVPDISHLSLADQEPQNDQ